MTVPKRLAKKLIPGALKPISRRRRVPVGAAPGTLVPVEDSPPPAIAVIAYDPEGLVEEEVDDMDELQTFIDEWPVTWISVTGLGDVDVLRRFEEQFGVHRLVLEDVLSGEQRTKIEPYGDNIFVIARRVVEETPLRTEQINFFLMNEVVITFQASARGTFEPVRNRLRHGNGRIRSEGSDYLFYALLDAVVDGYFPALDVLRDRLDTLEDTVMSDTSRAVYASIFETKRQLHGLRRVAWQLRELTQALLREPHERITKDTKVYLRDCHDHAITLLDALEASRDHAASVTEAYTTSVSLRMNQIMQTLTVISTIFIPLTFIAGLYGMNFDTSHPWNMPEVRHPYGYPIVVAIMTLIAIALMGMFVWLGWLRLSADPAQAPDRQRTS